MDHESNTLEGLYDIWQRHENDITLAGAAGIYGKLKLLIKDDSDPKYRDLYNKLHASFDIHDNSSLVNQLQSLLNKHSVENKSNTPDYILAKYMLECLAAFENAVRSRDVWYGYNPKLTHCQKSKL